MPSPLSRRSGPRIVIGRSVIVPSAASSKRSAGGKFSGQVPSTMTGITGRSGWRERNSRTSSLTAGRPAETVEHSTISAAEASSAAMVASVSVVPAGEVLAITEDRSQRLRYRPDGGVPTNPILVDAEGFEPAVQPLRPPRIVMAVAQERAVLERRDLGHAIPPASPALFRAARAEE